MRAAWFLLPLLWIGPAAHRAEQSRPAPSPPLDPASLLSDARALYRKGSFDQAIVRFNDVLKADPASGDAYAGMLRSYLKQDKVAEADEVLGKALQATPSHPDLRVAEGELLFRQGQILEAGKLFDEVISSPPIGAAPNPRAYLGAARVAAASALYERENALIRRAHDFDSSDPDIRKMWMRTLSTAARLQSLEEYLSQPTNDDEDTRRRLQEQADFLKASQAARANRCRSVSDVTGTKTTLTAVALGQNIQGSALDVEIDGKSARLLLDTGASGIMLSSKLAAQAGLKPLSDIRVGGIGDRPDSTAHIAYANTVQIGDMQFSNCVVEVVDRVPSTSDGIIGTDVFSQFLIDLDFPNSMLHLSELPRRAGEAHSKPSLNLGAGDPTTAQETNSSAVASSKQSPEAATISSTGAQAEDRYVAPEMHNYVQAFRIDHMLLVPTKVNEGAKKLFLLDTGAFDNTITPDAAKEVTKVHRAPRRDVRGMNGEVKKVYVADRVTLDFGHLRQTVPDMIAFDMSRISRQSGVEISGTLGMVMLTMLHVRLDYRDALVDFQYSPKPPRHQ